jgi:NAD(P)-dependent dehydrogenase (short-subunit alcohol dehydrogenase family)
MQTFEGKLAVITGGGTGIGRELARQLSQQGCHVSLCDLSSAHMAATRDLCAAQAPPGTRITTCVADVSDVAALARFREHVVRAHDTSHIHLLFNNAGIGGGGSFVAGPVDEWERVFEVTWGGVYRTTRTFVDLLVAAPAAHLINVSSVNGFWATLGPASTHTAYSTAKYAVRGFTEALINDFRLNAPHVRVSVVMPGHIGTEIVRNSIAILGGDPQEMSPAQLADTRARFERMGVSLAQVSDEALRKLIHERMESFRNDAPTTAAQAAEIILRGVREQRWRILVGDDAHALDRLVRELPEEVYEPSFIEKVQQETPWRLG